MKTESGMNDMNMDSTNGTARARNMRRRILASVCAIAIAVLQCAVIVSVGTETVYADTLTIKVKCGVGGVAETDVDTGTLSGMANDPIPGQEDKKGVTLKDLFDEVVGIENYKDINNGFSGDYLFEPTEMKVYKPDGSNPKGVSTIQYNMNDSYTPIESISINGSVTVQVDQTAEVSYDVQCEAFFEGYVNNYVEWSSGDTTIATVSNGVVKGIKKGNTSVILQSKAGNISDTGGVIVNEKPKDTDLKNAKINGVKNKKYTGKAIKQSGYEVVLDGVTLKEGTDYTVSYKNNTNPGTATMTVSAKSGSKYKNSKSVNFTITKDPPKKKSIGEASVSLSKTHYTEDGKSKKPGVTVKMGNKTLKEGTDYTVTYSNNLRAGTGKVTITGKGNYTGSVTRTFTISSSTRKASTRRYSTGTYRTYSARTTRSGNATTSTGTTVPTVTYAPDRTITVKEVFLGQEIIDEPEEQPTPADMMEEGWDDMNEDGSNNWEEPVDMSLDFGPMAGSAAVAVGACGVGVVGRIRKFKLDTATKVVEQVTNSKGKE